MLYKTQRIIVFTIFSLSVIIVSIFGVLLYSNILFIKSVNFFMILSSLLIIFSTVISVILAKSITLPLNKILRSAQLIIQGEKVDKYYLNPDSKRDQSDELIEMFTGINAELKEKLQEATRQKNEIETIILHMNDGVVSFDINGNITHINNAAEKYLGIDSSYNFKETMEIIDIPFTMEKLIFLDEISLAKKKSIKIDDKHLEIFFAPLKNTDNFSEGIVIVIQDISKHAELDEMRKRFVADVSHELKTPITSILGYSEILLLDEENLDKETKNRFQSTILRETKRMNELVNDLLTLSKYDSSFKNQQKEIFQITDIVKERVDVLKYEAEEKGLQLNSNITANIPLIYGDKKDITRVITNIISNAIKYTEKGTIDVYIGFALNDVYVKVKDTGIGIAQENIPKIFERFYRVEDSRVRNKCGGSGLGLSIVKKIMDENDGVVSVKSEYGVGTEVTLRFPKVNKLKV